MSPDRVLIGGAVVVVVAAIVFTAAVPGTVVSPDRGPEGPGRLDVRDMAISPGTISGETAELIVETRIAHAGPRAENVTVEFRATDLESGLLEATTEVPVEPIEGEREVAVNGSIRVTRKGGYQIDTIVYHDGRRIESASRRVTGLEALKPPASTSPVEFHRFMRADQPPIEYSIASTGNGTATLAVTTYLTNTGDEAAGDLRLVVKARQADSGIVADSTEVHVGEIRPSRTAAPTAELTVPTNYNYYLDAQLWADGAIVGEARSAANLDPTEIISVNETRREVDLEVSDFEDQRKPSRPERTATATAGQPGFTAGGAILALLVGVFLVRRWTHD